MRGWRTLEKGLEYIGKGVGVPWIRGWSTVDDGLEYIGWGWSTLYEWLVYFG